MSKPASRPAALSAQLFDRAQRVMPGGVNSPVRSFKAVGGHPLYIARGQGARLETVENRRLLDLCCSWGALLFGHARGEIVEAIARAARDGASYGANTRAEVDFAERLAQHVPGLERLRLVSSGTEAVMTAVRLARGRTGRPLLLKFSGGYHGHADTVLAEAGSGVLTGGSAGSAGVPPSVAADVLVAPYNDAESVREVVAAHGGRLAAILVEPVAANMGVVPPAPGFLEKLRIAADSCGALLILDEVITGFRFGPTTYGDLHGIRADLTCLGKIVGGGMPLGVVGGRADVMRELAPLGSVYQAGTLSGNPVAVAAGLATLKLIETEPPYEHLERMCGRLAPELERTARGKGLPFVCPRIGSAFTPFFLPRAPSNVAEAKTARVEQFAAFFNGMLENDVYLPPAQFEAAFISAAHTEKDIDFCLMAASAAFEMIAEAEV